MLHRQKGGSYLSALQNFGMNIRKPVCTGSSRLTRRSGGRWVVTSRRRRLPGEKEIFAAIMTENKCPWVCAHVYARWWSNLMTDFYGWSMIFNRCCIEAPLTLGPFGGHQMMLVVCMPLRQAQGHLFTVIKTATFSPSPRSLHSPSQGKHHLIIFDLRFIFWIVTPSWVEHYLSSEGFL